MIIDHNDVQYKRKRATAGHDKHNGAYYYSREITKNIIPLIETDRNWVTVNVKGQCFDHSIVFIHNNLKPDLYDWLADYKDLVLVCGVPETCDKVKHLGIPIYLPLSIDVENVAKFRCEKTKEVAYAGRYVKRLKVPLTDCDFLEGMPRNKLLSEMAQYKKIYAVGRTAIEAKCLGCEVLVYDERYPDPELWQVLDNKDAAKILQRELDKIDG